MDDSRSGDGARLHSSGNERRDESPVGTRGTDARHTPARSAADLITWPFVLYVLVLGFVCVLLVPLTNVWWIVPMLGAIVPIVLVLFGGRQSGPNTRLEMQTPDLAGAPVERGEPVPDLGHRSTSESADFDWSPLKASHHEAASAVLDDPLSEREREVLEVLATGKTTSEAARDLFVSVGTIKSHTSNIYRKLGARNRAEAIARARELGLLS